MISIHSLWALADQLGFGPAALLVKIGEKAITDAGGKAAAAVGQRLAGSVQAVLSHWAARINEGFPEYLRERLGEVNETQRPAIVEAYFEEWVQSHTNDAFELSRLLFRLIYLRALVDYCSDLPVVGGTETRLKLDDVWVPQAFRTIRLDQPRQRRTDDLRFESLSQAIASCGAPFALIGNSGARKSTQLRKLVVDQARRQLETTDFEQLLTQPLPVYVRAVTLAQQRADFTTAITQAISQEMALRLPFRVPEDFFDPRQPGAPRSLFTIIDGLDEISPEGRNDLIANIENHGEAFSILVASRSILASSAFSPIEIEEPTPEDADKLIEKLAPYDARYERINAAGLPRNPLVLTLAALLKRGRISSRAARYQEFILDRLGRSPEPSLREGQAGFRLLQSSALLETDIDGQADRLAAELGLLSDGILGRSRSSRARALLVSTGIVRQEGERLSFIHESFRSYLRSEAMAREHQPQAAPWRAISPFREGWETIAFTIEVWRRDGWDTTSALEDLLAFREPGLRLIAQLASRDPDLPTGVIELAVAKWMHGGEEHWDAGLIDGPVQQLTLMAIHYESARAALRTIARDEWTFSEDAAYAAQGLANAGFKSEACAFLVLLSRKTNAYCGSRVLAVELLIEIDAKTEARTCADELAGAWASEPPDMNLSSMRLAEAFHKLGRKRAAIEILNELDDELNDELDLRVLAETYLAIGKPRKARVAALRAFKTMEWARDSFRGYVYQATEMANLLDRVGASKEVAFVRRNLKRLEDQSTEALRVAAVDAESRLKNAVELFKRNDDFGVAALEALMNDPGASQYERFNAAPHLLASSARRAGIASLKRIAMDEPWHRVSCGTALVHGGEPEEGCAILSKIAFEPAESIAKRSRAIEQLAQSGRIDLAIAAFRRLLFGGELKSRPLEDISNAFAHTSAWGEFLDCCDELLSSSDPALRVEALSILIQAKRLDTGSRRAEKLLRSIVLDRNLSPDLRMAAARKFEEMGLEEAIELVFDITTSPVETMEAGIEAMEFLHRRDEFMALDGGNDVVWDKKLSPDEFIEAAHAYLSIMPRRSEADSTSVGEEMCDIVIKALQGIATDATQPIERRLAASRMKDLHEPHNSWHDPFWLGVESICQDQATPIRLRLPAIRRVLRKDPTRIESWRTVLEGGEIGHLEVAYVYLAAERRDAAVQHLHLSLAEETDLQVRARILKELALLVEVSFAGRQAAEELSDAFNSDQVDAVDADLVKDLLLLSRAALSEGEFIDLAKAAANHQGLDIYDIEPALAALTNCGAVTAVGAILEARKSSLQRQLQTDGSAFYDLIHLYRVQAHLGDRSEVAKELNDICSSSQLSISNRAFACRILSQIGRTADARARLRRLLTRATTCAELLAIGRAAIDIHDWSLARRTFLDLATSVSTTLSERVECAGGLARVGLKEIAARLLSSVDLIASDLVWQGGVGSLAACGQAERAIAVCRDYVARADVCALDKMEAIGKLGDAVSKEIAREIIVSLAKKSDCDVSASARGAELLHTLGFEAEARSILFKIATLPIPDAGDALWITDTLLLCHLPFTAERILKSLVTMSLDSEERQRYVELQSEARFAQLGSASRAN